MKKVLSFSFLFLLLMAPLITSAQVNLDTYFVIEENNAIYEEFTDGETSVSGLNQAANYDLPFSFLYDGIEYNQVRICTNGWVGVGGDITHAASANNLSLPNNFRLLAACWDNLRVVDGVGEIRYKTEGIDPERAFVVQYKDATKVGIYGDKVNFQIRIFEGNGGITFTYGEMDAINTAWTASVGVSGATGGNNNFISITPDETSTYSSSASNNSIAAAGINQLTYKRYTFLPVGDYVYLNSPSNGEIIETTISLTWEDAQAWTYLLQVSTEPDFSTTVVNDSSLTSTSYDLYNLEPVTRYYWRVRFMADEDYSSWSQVWSFFTTGDLPAPALILPENNEIDAETVPKFEWENSSFADSYSLQVSAEVDFSDPVIEEANLTSNYFIATGLSMNTQYYWRVRMQNQYDIGTWSNAWTFTTGNYIIVGAEENYQVDPYGYEAPSPYSCWYTSARSYFLYTAEELIEGGAVPNGNTYITDFGWNLLFTPASSSTHRPGEFAVRMKLTPMEELSGTWNYEGWQTVWEPTEPFPPQRSWNMHSCIDPFFWDGTSGILVETCFSHWDKSGGSNPTQFWTTTSVARCQNIYQYIPGGPEVDYCAEEQISFGTTSLKRANIKFKVIQMAVARPSLFSPELGEVNVSLNPTLMWSEVEGAVSYAIQLSKNPDFEELIIDEEVLYATEYFVLYGNDLEETTRYYWRVQASDGDNLSLWSLTWDFLTTGSLPEAVLLSPEDESTGFATKLNLTWESFDEATGYKVQVAIEDSFEDPIIDATVLNTNSYTAYGLSMSTQYFWRVRMFNESVEGNWSEPWSFSTSNMIVVGSGNNYDLDYYNYISPSPYSNQTVHSRIYYLFTAEELLEAGAVPDSYITNFGWNIAVNQPSIDYHNPGEYAIRMKQTQMTQLTGAWDYEDWQTVWEPTEPWLAQLDWNMHDCIEPFYWDGESSILVETCHSHWNKQQTIANPQQYWTTTSNFKCQYVMVGPLIPEEKDYCAYEESSNGTTRLNRANIKFTIVQPTLARPILTTPAKDTLYSSTMPTFTWVPVESAESYSIQVSTSYDFETLVIDESGIQTAEFQVPEDSELEEVTKYYWRINATDGENVSFWSFKWNFVTVGDLPVPILVSPELEADGVNPSALLTWEAHCAASGYNIKVDVNPDFDDPIYSTTLYRENTCLIDRLTIFTRYYWKVQMFNDLGESQWSEPWAFSTGDFAIVGIERKSNGQTSYPVPYGNFRMGAKHQILILAEELFSAGATANSISFIALNIGKLYSNARLSNFEIRMKQTNDEFLAVEWDDEGFTTVYNNPSLLCALGWNTHQFSEPFLWDGSSNVLLDFCFNNEASTYNQIVFRSTTASNSVRYYAADETTVCSNPGVASVSAQRPNMKFGFEPSDYFLPPLLTSPQNSAQNQSITPSLVWESAEGATNYQVQLADNPDFGNPIVNTVVEGTEYEVMIQLEQLEDYYWQVRAVSESGLLSSWSEVWSFTTLELPALDQVTLAQPEDGLTDAQVDNLPMSWNSVQGANYYTFQINDSEDFSEVLLSQDFTVRSLLVSGFSYATTYYWRVMAKSDEGNIGPWSEVWSFTTIAEPALQEIAINSGWNIISSYVNPDDPDMFELFEDALNNINVVKNGDGQMFIPQQEINNIGDWNIADGYLINANSSFNLAIEGIKVIPEETPLALDGGWNLVPYLRTSALSTNLALATISDEITLAKNNSGGIYFPAWGLNTVGNMLSGQGYWIYTSQAGVLTYPENSAGKIVTDIELSPLAKQLVPIYKNTGNNATLLLQFDGIENGAEVGVYNVNDELIGSGAVHNGVAALTIWGDDEITKQVDGATHSELLSVKLLSNNALQNVSLYNIKEITKDIEQDNLIYETNAIYLAKATVLNSDELIFSISCVPNPAANSTTFEFSLANEGDAVIEIYTLNGELIAKVGNNYYTPGVHKLNFDLSNLLNGVYNIVLNSSNKRASSLMIINK